MNAEGLLHEYYVNRSENRTRERLTILKAKHAICEVEIELHKHRVKKGDSDAVQKRIRINEKVMSALEISESILNDVDSLIFLNRALLSKNTELENKIKSLEEQIEFLNNK